MYNNERSKIPDNTPFFSPTCLFHKEVGLGNPFFKI
jgi:hypothetical protein